MMPDSASWKFGTISHVFFDVDGTLIDSLPAIVGAYRHAFATVLGIDYPRSDDEVRAILAPRLDETCARVGGEQAGACADAYRAAYAEQAGELIRAMPGASELLEELVGRGIGVGIVTNKGGERLFQDLARARLDHVPFSAVVAAEHSVERKPHPRPLLLALEQAGCEASEAMYVGDGPHDIAAARAARMASVGVAFGYYGAARLAEHGPDAIIEALLDLLVVLEPAVVR